MKKNKSHHTIKLSDRSINYISKYLLSNHNIPITTDLLDTFIDISIEFEEELASKELIPNYSFDEIRAIEAAFFVSETSGIILFNNIIDINDLNAKLSIERT